jgi:hypothetical protein
MTTKKTARLGVSFWREGEGVILTDDDWKRLEVAASIVFPDNCRIEIINAMNNYRVNREGWAKSVGSGEAKAFLEDIAAAAGALEKLMTRFSDGGVGEAAGDQIALVEFTKLQSRITDLPALRGKVARLRYLAKTAVENIGEGKRSKVDPHMHEFILALHRPFKDAGGEYQHTAPFIEFATVSLELAGKEILPDTDVGEWVKQAFGKKVP